MALFRRVWFLKRCLDFEYRRAAAHTAAVLSELQNCASALPDVVSQRDSTLGFDRHRQRASRARRAG